jgi:hypothetical protein
MKKYIIDKINNLPSANYNLIRLACIIFSILLIVINR